MNFTYRDSEGNDSRHDDVWRALDSLVEFHPNVPTLRCAWHASENDLALAVEGSEAQEVLTLLDDTDLVPHEWLEAKPSRTYRETLKDGSWSEVESHE